MPKKAAKKLALVCKCGDCSHWEIILTITDQGTYEDTSEAIKCMSCGDVFNCSFNIGPHEGLHYEHASKHGKAKACSTKS